MSVWAVTGAAGYVGSHVAARLRAEGEQVVELTRRDGDVRDAAAMSRLLAGSDIVVHCVAWVHRTPSTAAEIEECRSINVDGTRTVLEAAQSAGARAFVFISSASVYGPYDRMIREDDPCDPQVPYGRTKLEAEAIVKAARSERLDTVILRPAVVIGPGAPGNFQRMASFMRWRVFPLVDGGRTLKSVVPIDTLAAAIVAVGRKHRQVSGSVFNVVGGTLSMKEIAALTAGAFGFRVLFIPVPGVVMRTLGAIASAVPGLNQLARRIEAFGENTALDGSRLESTLEFRSPVSVTEAIRESVRGQPQVVAAGQTALRPHDEDPQRDRGDGKHRDGDRL